MPARKRTRGADHHTWHSLSRGGIGIGRKASSRLGAKAEVFGGLILIAIGTRILLEHLGVIG
ncbi:MAG: manganese efflux pump [Alistipes ihumii]